MTRPPWFLPALLLSASLLACGAKTGLSVPDAGLDADVPEADVFVRFEVCVAGRFNMVRRSARLLFVIDRSGSMNAPLEMSSARTRWEAMRGALVETLPRYERALEMGAFVYPRVPTDTAPASLQNCELTGGDSVDSLPARANSRGVLDAIDRAGPRGATPTAAALVRATDFLRARDARGVAQYIVLATDGLPNCNRTLDPQTCRCFDPATCRAQPSGTFASIDDTSSIAAVDRARGLGIATWVIGIDGDLDAQYLDILDRMAVAGGRARPGTDRRYYSIRAEGQLTEAFEAIQRTVAECAYVTPSRPDNPDRITVEVDGVAVPRDPTRRDGWDWTDRDYGEVTLFGAACERVQSSTSPLRATVACGL